MNLDITKITKAKDFDGDNIVFGDSKNTHDGTKFVVKRSFERPDDADIMSGRVRLALKVLRMRKRKIINV